MLVGGSGHKIRLFVDILELPLAIMEMHSFDGEVGRVLELLRARTYSLLDRHHHLDHLENNHYIHHHHSDQNSILQ